MNKIDQDGELAQSTSRRPRSDIGTIFFHWATVIAFVVSLVTGLRISIFGYIAPRFAGWLSPILPQGEMWTWHFYTGLSLFVLASGYCLYLRRGGLGSRNALSRLRTILMAGAGKFRWGAINVGLHWLAYALISVLMTTGVVLYLGYGGVWVWIHSVSALIGSAYFFVHVITHYVYGGWPQLLRLFRPSKLIATPAVRPYPLLVALAVGFGTAAIAAAIDWMSRDTLIVGPQIRHTRHPRPLRVIVDY